MNDRYYTVRGLGQAEVEISRSRFIAYVSPAATEDAALTFIEKIRKQHWDATHNCSAYIVGDNDGFQKGDDDGEPSGTAGRPMLEVIKKLNVKDTVVVVTRYFGGIKLGAGGLVRAYSKSAAAGLEAAGVVERRLHTALAVTISYGLLGTVENQLRGHDYCIIDKQFAETVIIVCLVPTGSEETVKKKLADWTSGQAETAEQGQMYVDMSQS